MKLALFIALVLVTLHGIAVVSAYSNGYVYAIGEYINQNYNGYIKVGHSSDSNGQFGRYINIKRRFSNMQTGNPRRLRWLYICQCNSKATAERVETTVRARLPHHANQLGGSNEWLRIPSNRVRSFLRLMRRTARGQRYQCTCPFNLPQGK